MITKTTFATTNIPYGEESQDRPSFYNVESQSFNLQDGMVDYYKTPLTNKPIVGKFNRLDFARGYIYVGLDRMRENPSFATASLDRIRNLNHCLVETYEDDTTTLIESAYGFVDKVSVEGMSNFRFDLKLDVGATYGLSLQIDSTGNAMVKRKHENRGIKETIDSPWVSWDRYNSQLTLLLGFTTFNDPSFVDVNYNPVGSQDTVIPQLDEASGGLGYNSNSFVATTTDPTMTPSDLVSDASLFDDTNPNYSGDGPPNPLPSNAYVVETGINFGDQVDGAQAQPNLTNFKFSFSTMGVNLRENAPEMKVGIMLDGKRSGVPEISLLVGEGVRFKINEGMVVKFKNLILNDTTPLELHQWALIGDGFTKLLDTPEKKMIPLNGTIPVQYFYKGYYGASPTPIVDFTLNPNGNGKVVFNVDYGNELVRQTLANGATPLFPDLTPEQIASAHIGLNPNVLEGDYGIDEITIEYQTPTAHQITNYSFDFGTTRGIWFDDKRVLEYKAKFNYSESATNKYMVRSIQARDQTIKFEDPLVFTEPTLFTKNIALSHWGGNSLPNNVILPSNVFAYAVVSFLGSLVKEGDKITGNLDIKNGKALPFLIGPLSANDYNLICRVGSPSIVDIFTSPFPLISDYLWSKMSKLSTFGTYNGFTGNDDPLVLNINDVNTAQQQFVPFYEQTRPWGDNWTIPQPIGDEEWDSKRELRCYTSPHFKYVLRNATIEKEIFTENLFGYNDGDNNKLLTINYQPIINGMSLINIGRIENGFYNQAYDLNQKGLIVEMSATIPNTSSAYTTFFQNHSNAFNTSKGALKAGFGVNTLNSYLGGGATGVQGGLQAMGGNVLGGASNVLGGIAGFATNMIKNSFNFAKGMRELDSQQKDLENNTMDVKNITANDNIGLTMISPNPQTNSGNDVASNTFDNEWGVPQSYLYVSTISPNEQNSVAQIYHRDGYIVNNFSNFNSLNEFCNGRNNFNFGEISSFENVIARSPHGKEVKDGFIQFFDNGARLWNSRGFNGAKVNYLDYLKENGETNVFLG